MSQLRHIVLFGFKDGTTEQEVAEIARRFATLKDAIPGVEAFEWGPNNSPEGMEQGHSHCFTLTFTSPEARDAYLPHPEHKAFVGWASAWIERVLVFDYHPQ